MLKIKNKLLLLTVIFICLFSIEVFAAANIKTYTVKTEEKNISSNKIFNLTTIQYSKPSPIYDFFDENEKLNVLYTSEDNVYWAKFDNNLNVTETIKIRQFYDKSNTPESYSDLVSTFGNALYYEGYLYIVYGRQANKTDSSVVTDKYTTMALIKYDKKGNIVDELEFIAAENNSTTDWSYGTNIPFFTNANCSLTVNDEGIIACFFGKTMFNAHQMSGIFFVDANTMEWVSNRYYANDENKAKYANIIDYYTSHSFAQRIIPTSDGGFLMADSVDASSRGLVITKIYKDSEENFQRNSFKMINYSEGDTGSHGYNNTYSLVGNIIELSDGYMYVGALERTLSMSYGNSINGSWDILVQKYSKDFYTKDSIKDMQLLDAEVREPVGPASEYNGYGRLYLDGTEKDYGIKWLTDYQDKKSVVQLRAVEMENDQIAILYELIDLTVGEDVGELTYESEEGEVYYMVIDSNGKIISEPTIVPNIYLTPEEILAYKDGKIYWTSTQKGNAEIVVNVLDVKNPKLPFADVSENAWYYSAVKYNYENGMIKGLNATIFGPTKNLTRGMLVTILHRMEGSPSVSGASKFTDVQNTKDYYYTAVKWATQNNIVSGYNSGKFGANDAITREQLAVILSKYSKFKGKYKVSTASLSSFSDANKVSSFAKTGMQWAVGNRVITGNASSKTLNPQGTTTRAEAASMLYKYNLNIK